MHADGSESKGFHIRDGAGIVWAQRAGLTVGLLSARSSGATAHRAAQLAIRIVEQGVRSKLAAYEQIIRDARVEDAEVAYMGDDLLDLQVLGARRSFRCSGRCGAGSSRARRLGQQLRRRPRRRARARRIDPPRAATLGRRAAPASATGVMDGYVVLLGGLVALLVGLAMGKAWERYKLRDGQWIDRRRARESPHYMLGLNFLGDQSDRSGHRRADTGCCGRRRSARDPSDPREPLSREGTGRPRHPGASEAAAAPGSAQAGTRQRPALPRPRLQAGRVRRSGARGVQRMPAPRS